ncbi:MAG: polysaccharide deacetylase family protein [Bacteroidales bacterium]|nr:polysaccharide deacetylase family protein [Bacteroidales bacterium]
MLKIKYPDNYQPEREYILRVLFEEFAGLEIEWQCENRTDYLLMTETSGELLVKDDFFNRFGDHNYLHKANIPSQIGWLSQRNKEGELIPVIFGEPHVEEFESQIICHADLFASAFFMLSRWEEVVNENRDQHDRFRATESVAVQHDFIHRPIVNEYLELLLGWLKKLGLKQNMPQREFQWVLTHDIDKISWDKNYWRSLARDLLKQGNPQLVWKKLTQIFRNPYDTFDKLMDWSEQAGVKSRFYFMAGGNGEYDYENYLQKDSFKESVQKIQKRGHIIGFHPGYATYRDESEWKEQKNSLAQVIGQPINEGRQHFLRVRIPETWQIWDENDMETDSSMGFAEIPGFRCGTCYTFTVFDVKQRKTLRLKEMPLIAMDVTYANYLKYSPRQTLDNLREIKKRIVHFGGNFVILWHNSNLYAEFWPLYLPVYKKLISED